MKKKKKGRRVRDPNFDNNNRLSYFARLTKGKINSIKAIHLIRPKKLLLIVRKLDKLRLG